MPAKGYKSHTVKCPGCEVDFPAPNITMHMRCKHPELNYRYDKKTKSMIKQDARRTTDQPRETPPLPTTPPPVIPTPSTTPPPVIPTPPTTPSPVIPTPKVRKTQPIPDPPASVPPKKKKKEDDGYRGLFCD